jgi:hypothetical protein
MEQKRVERDAREHGDGGTNGPAACGAAQWIRPTVNELASTRDTGWPIDHARSANR